MNITTVNISPVELKYQYTDTLSQIFDPIELIKKTIAEPIFNPAKSKTAAEIKCDNQNLTPDDITNMLIDCSRGQYDPKAEEKMDAVFSKTLLYYEKTDSLSVQDIFAIQAAKKNNIILPSKQVLYTVNDIIDVSKQFINDEISYDEFFSTLSFAAKIQALGCYFINEQAWQDFIEWFNKQIISLQNYIDINTSSLCQSFAKIKLNKLTEGLIIRNDDGQNNNPYSFARLVPSLMSIYQSIHNKKQKTKNVMGLLPFTFGEAYCPRVIILLNVERHAKANQRQLMAEYNTIRSSIDKKPEILSLDTITKLTALEKNANKIIVSNGMKSMAMNFRSAEIKFRNKPPTYEDMYRYIEKIYKHTQYVLNSNNAIKITKPTYNRPSRRHPDNPDLMGRTKITVYRPDLHIYLDCSGSINESMYQDGIMACIKLAKKMNVNFYFSSFSHTLSAPTKLHIANRTPKQIYKEFHSIPKVGGGTDFEQIWHSINRSKELSKRVSIIITDFGYYAPTKYVKQPEYLYYMPITTYAWDRIVEMAKNFTKSMLHNQPDIRKKILM